MYITVLLLQAPFLFSQLQGEDFFLTLFAQGSFGCLLIVQIKKINKRLEDAFGCDSAQCKQKLIESWTRKIWDYT